MSQEITSNSESVFEFPCEFPIKAIGYATDAFEAAVVMIIRRHATDVSEGAFKIRQSKKGLYTSMTVTIQAISQKQIDAIYQELSVNEHIIMAL